MYTNVAIMLRVGKVATTDFQPHAVVVVEDSGARKVRADGQVAAAIDLRFAGRRVDEQTVLIQ